jgi:hypothetical protein
MGIGNIFEIAPDFEKMVVDFNKMGIKLYQ